MLRSNRIPFLNRPPASLKHTTHLEWLPNIRVNMYVKAQNGMPVERGVQWLVALETFRRLFGPTRFIDWGLHWRLDVKIRSNLNAER
jgi:hypothetical protein